MTRVIHALIGLTYALGALVAAAAAMRFADATPLGAWTLAGVLASAAGQLHRALLLREADRRRDDDIEALRQANLALLEELESARERADALDTAIAAERARREAALAEEVARLEQAMRHAAREAGSASSAQDRATAAPSAPVIATPEDVRDAIDARRVDLLMQPVVTLPQRRTAHYEAFTHLRTSGGRTLEPPAWLPAARSAGLLVELDALLLRRCVRIARRLSAQERRIGVFCNLAAENFHGARFAAMFGELREALDVAGSLILEITQRDYRGLDAAAMRNLMRLADYGFRFALDQVEDLDESFAGLRRANVRFLKVDAARLVEALSAGGPLGLRDAPDILAADYAVLMQRHGVSLIAEKLETESAVIETLEYDIAFGQGRLFGPPRPVRDDVISDVDAHAVDAPALDAAAA